MVIDASRARGWYVQVGTSEPDGPFVDEAAALRRGRKMGPGEIVTHFHDAIVATPPPVSSESVAKMVLRQMGSEDVLAIEQAIVVDQLNAQFEERRRAATGIVLEKADIQALIADMKEREVLGDRVRPGTSIVRAPTKEDCITQAKRIIEGDARGTLAARIERAVTRKTVVARS